jgi:hypothetical protein
MIEFWWPLPSFGYVLDLIFVSHELVDDLLDLFDGSGDDLHDQVDLELRWNDPNILRSENKINFQML